MTGTGSEDRAAPADRTGLRMPWSASDRPVPRRVLRPLQEFLRTSTASGVLLVAAAFAALVWANSPWGDAYDRLWTTRLGVQLGRWSLAYGLRGWVNEGLMALFFLVAGLEIKREFLTGELRDRRAAALPLVAALGGMVVPALLYVVANLGGPGVRGWGAAMPTDIALTLGVLALAGPTVPASLRLFALTLAIVDDIGTIVVIALFYSGRVAPAWLVVAIGIVAFTVALQRIHVRASAVYVSLALGLWLALHAAGTPAALAGVIVGLLTPVAPFQRPRAVSEEARRVADATADEPEPPDVDAHHWLRLATLSREAVSPLARVEHELLPWVSFLILPLFALANAGVKLDAGALAEASTSPVALGIAFLRVAGKVLGIWLACTLAVRWGIARLPLGVRWLHIVGAAAAAGMAFTVSIFVAELAFVRSPGLVDVARVGVLGSVFVGGGLGIWLLRRAGRVVS
jgi:NhaA family Na+:H+ antiporter